MDFSLDLYIAGKNGQRLQHYKSFLLSARSVPAMKVRVSNNIKRCFKKYPQVTEASLSDGHRTIGTWYKEATGKTEIA